MNMKALVLRVIGLIFLLSPPFVYWIIYGSYERYLWVINGPFPFSELGSLGPKLLLFILLFLIGGVLFDVSFREKHRANKETDT
jgi:hypothetical protein